MNPPEVATVPIRPTLVSRYNLEKGETETFTANNINIRIFHAEPQLEFFAKRLADGLWIAAAVEYNPNA